MLKINLNYDPKEVFGRGHNPIVRNIHLDRITCNSSQYGIFIIGLEEVQNVYDIHFCNSRLNGVSKQPMRIEGMVAPTDVKGLVINGTKVK